MKYDFAKNKDKICGILVQNPDNEGIVHEYTRLAADLKKMKIIPCIAVDPLAISIMKTPGEMGFELAFGNSARFGCPMGFGGPHAAFFSACDRLKRKIPGRIVGLSKDAEGNPAYRLAL